MQDLRLVGVHDDGEHLLLSGTGGEMFQLPIDEALRVAASRTSAKTASSAAAAPYCHVSARHPDQDPQRADRRRSGGAVRNSAGESPALRGPGPGRTRVHRRSRPARWRSPPPPRATTPTGRCSVKTRRPSATWSSTGSGPTASNPQPWSGIPGDVPTAAGTWWPASSPSPAARPESARSRRPCGPSTPPGRSLQNANRWAQQLSELEPLEGPVPTRRLTAVSDRPFDFETDAEAAARTATGQHSIIHQMLLQQDRIHQEQDADGLLDMLRSRRGQRIGVDEDADDALATLLTTGVPAAHPRPSEVPEAGFRQRRNRMPSPNRCGRRSRPEPRPIRPHQPAGLPDSGSGGGRRVGNRPFTRRRDGRPSMHLPADPRTAPAEEDDALKLHDGVSTETREITIAASQLRPAGQEGPTSSPGLDELIGGGTSRRQHRESHAAARNDRGHGAARAPAGQAEALQRSELGRNRLRSPQRPIRTAGPAVSPAGIQAGISGPHFRQRISGGHVSRGAPFFRPPGSRAAGLPARLSSGNRAGPRLQGQWAGPCVYRRSASASRAAIMTSPIRKAASARTSPNSPPAIASSRVKAHILSAETGPPVCQQAAAGGVVRSILEVEVDHPRLARGVAHAGERAPAPRSSRSAAIRARPPFRGPP